jgi:hypothetical protein
MAKVAAVLYVNRAFERLSSVVLAPGNTGEPKPLKGSCMPYPYSPKDIVYSKAIVR